MLSRRYKHCTSPDLSSHTLGSTFSCILLLLISSFWKCTLTAMTNSNTPNVYIQVKRQLTEANVTWLSILTECQETYSYRQGFHWYVTLKSSTWSPRHVWGHQHNSCHYTQHWLWFDNWEKHLNPLSPVELLIWGLNGPILSYMRLIKRLQQGGLEQL